MKTDAIRRFRAKLAADRPVYGLWITLESASVAEMAVALGIDWVVIDAEHGHLDWKEILEHVRATSRSDTVALVRIAQLDVGLVKRALDIGADGVVVPWVETVHQLDRAVACAKYPPEGVRGIGGDRATAWGQCVAQHAREANEHVLVVPLLESVAAGRNIEGFCRSKSCDLFFYGPSDYSASAGYRGQWEGPGIAEEILATMKALRAAGKQCGIQATGPANLVERRLQGFRMIGLGSDVSLLARGLRSALGVVGRDRPFDASLAPAREMLPASTPIPAPPELLRPDRTEALAAPGAAPALELGPGVAFDCHAGSRTQTRHLTAGWVSFEPGARLAAHTHPFFESITAVDGPFVVSVEGREYRLGPLDNILVPAGLVHSAWNPSASGKARVHVVLASDNPTRELVALPPESRAMPEDSTGMPGKERVTRPRSAPPAESDAATRAFDYFNGELAAQAGMSGGYLVIQPGGRLPAHVHEFDEVVSVVEGTATRLVEGRRAQLGAYCSGLQPGGRVHSFLNDTRQPVGLLWFAASGFPERIIVAESCLTPEGDPWREIPAHPAGPAKERR